MVVAEGKEREKPVKREQRKNPQTRVRTSGETNTSPSWPTLICIGQAHGGGDKKRRSQDGWRPLLWVGLSSYLKGVLSFVCE